MYKGDDNYERVIPTRAGDKVLIFPVICSSVPETLAHARSDEVVSIFRDGRLYLKRNQGLWIDMGISEVALKYALIGNNHCQRLAYPVTDVLLSHVIRARRDLWKQFRIKFRFIGNEKGI